MGAHAPHHPAAPSLAITSASGSNSSSLQPRKTAWLFLPDFALNTILRRYLLYLPEPMANVHGKSACVRERRRLPASCTLFGPCLFCTGSTGPCTALLWFHELQELQPSLWVPGGKVSSQIRVVF